MTKSIDGVVKAVANGRDLSSRCASVMRDLIIGGVSSVTLRLLLSFVITSVPTTLEFEVASAGVTVPVSGCAVGCGWGFCCATCETVRGLVWLSGLLCAQAGLVNRKTATTDSKIGDRFFILDQESFTKKFSSGGDES